MQAVMASMLWFITSRPASLSSVMQVITYMGGAISLMRTGQSDVPGGDRRLMGWVKMNPTNAQWKRHHKTSS